MINLKRNYSSRPLLNNNHLIPVIDLLSGSPALPEAPSSLRIVDSSSYNSKSSNVLRKESTTKKFAQIAPLSFMQVNNDVEDFLISQTNQLGIQYQEQYTKQNKHENNERRAEVLHT